MVRAGQLVLARKEGAWQEGGGAHLGAVDDLVGDDDVARADLLTQRADGGEADDGPDAEVLERGNVGAGGDGRGRDVVVRAVASQERELDRAFGRVERSDRDGRGRRAPGLCERCGERGERRRRREDKISSCSRRPEAPASRTHRDGVDGALNVQVVELVEARAADDAFIARFREGGGGGGGGGGARAGQLCSAATR